MGITPLQDWILVEIIKNQSGIRTSDSVEDTDQVGRVIKSGPGTYYANTFVPNTAKEGDIITWTKFKDSDDTPELNKKGLTMIRERDCMFIGKVDN